MTKFTEAKNKNKQNNCSKRERRVFIIDYKVWSTKKLTVMNLYIVNNIASKYINQNWQKNKQNLTNPQSLSEILTNKSSEKKRLQCLWLTQSPNLNRERKLFNRKYRLFAKTWMISQKKREWFLSLEWKSQYTLNQKSCRPYFLTIMQSA